MYDCENLLISEVLNWNLEQNFYPMKKKALTDCSIDKLVWERSNPLEYGVESIFCFVYRAS